MNLFNYNKGAKLRTNDKQNAGSKSTKNIKTRMEERDVESGELDECIEGSITQVFSGANS